MGRAEDTECVDVVAGAFELEAICELDAGCVLDAACVDVTELEDAAEGADPAFTAPPLELKATGGPGMVNEWKLSAQISGKTTLS